MSRNPRKKRGRFNAWWLDFFTRWTEVVWNGLWFHLSGSQFSTCPESCCRLFPVGESEDIFHQIPTCPSATFVETQKKWIRSGVSTKAQNDGYGLCWHFLVPWAVGRSFGWNLGDEIFEDPSLGDATWLAGGFFLFSRICGEDFQFDSDFSDGWGKTTN